MPFVPKQPLKQKKTPKSSVADAAMGIVPKVKVPKPAPKPKATYLLDEWEQIKTFFRKGTRPSQIQAIAMFEKHLKEELL